jgi:hypothetical protein
MTKSKQDSARRQANRVAVLERRMRQLIGRYHPTPNQVAEISAIEWALPILEKHIQDVFGEELAHRVKWHKHEKQAIINSLWDQGDDICYLCNEKMRYQEATIDHVIPLAKGGKDDMSNYKLTHSHCNLEKGNMLLEVYLEWRARHYDLMA